MNEQELFQELKKRILETYQNTYPYFQGDWKNFSSKDIRQLIDLIEVQLKERVSEKWIYTHLKPESNEKLPRKDMLDIFSRFAGFSDWDEFSFKNNSKTEIDFREVLPQKNETKRKFNKALLFILFLPLVGFVIYEWVKNKESKTVILKNEFTKEPVQSDEIKVYKVTENKESPIEVVDSKIEIEDTNEKLVIESPYFEKKEIQISEMKEEIYMKPEDYALVLKTFINSDLTDWQTRKEKLNKILSNELEVIILLKENLGAEYLNKKEFSEKLIIPTTEIKKMRIIHLETNENKEITFIRIQQL